MFLRAISIILLVVFLASCGGGGSSDGAGQGANNDVTFCIVAVQRTVSPGNGIAPITSTDYTNTCDFAVNFGFGIAGLTLNIVQLAPGAAESSIVPIRFVACRPPSQPFLDRDGSSPGVYKCT